MDGERLCFSPVDEDSCCGILSWRSLRIVLKLVEQLKLDMFPESFTVDGVEGLSQVNESHANVPVLFLIFLLNLPGHKDHVRGSSEIPAII